MSFNQEWLEAAKNAPSISLPFSRPVVMITSDVSSRASVCRACHSPILKGSDRVVVFVRHEAGLKMPNGGTAHGRKFFFHAGCFGGVVRKKYVGPRCKSCGHFTKRGSIAIHENGYNAVGYVCETCADSGKYAPCGNCRHWYAVLRLSPVVSSPSITGLGRASVGEGVCDFCAKSWGIRRQKEVEKEKREDERFEQKMLEIRELIIRDGLFEKT